MVALLGQTIQELCPTVVAVGRKDGDEDEREHRSSERCVRSAMASLPLRILMTVTFCQRVGESEGLAQASFRDLFP